ncbi:helix-turn-helix domain-containing protein [bacterium]|jgi:DNA-binding MarR family transcriptional regulator|nr:helix-turn-helix domain-containing protein [bacterium]
MSAEQAQPQQAAHIDAGKKQEPLEGLGGFTKLPVDIQRLLPKLTKAEILLLLALMARANGDGVCWPGTRRLASDIELSVSRVKQARKALREGGLIEWTDPATSGRKTNLYRLTPLKHVASSNDRQAPQDPQVVQPVAHTTVQPTAPSPVQSVVPKVDTCKRDTSNEKHLGAPHDAATQDSLAADVRFWANKALDAAGDLDSPMEHWEARKVSGALGTMMSTLHSVARSRGLSRISRDESAWSEQDWTAIVSAAEDQLDCSL